VDHVSENESAVCNAEDMDQFAPKEWDETATQPNFSRRRRGNAEVRCRVAGPGPAKT